MDPSVVDVHTHNNKQQQQQQGVAHHQVVIRGTHTPAGDIVADGYSRRRRQRHIQCPPPKGATPPLVSAPRADGDSAPCQKKERAEASTEFFAMSSEHNVMNELDEAGVFPSFFAGGDVTVPQIQVQIMEVDVDLSTARGAGRSADPRRSSRSWWCGSARTSDDGSIRGHSVDARANAPRSSSAPIVSNGLSQCNMFATFHRSESDVS